MSSVIRLCDVDLLSLLVNALPSQRQELTATKTINEQKPYRSLNLRPITKCHEQLRSLVDRQRRGIGSALIVRGIEECRAAGWPAIIVVGHTGYYPRFGFSAALVSHLESPYAGTHFMGLELRSGALTRVFGRVRYPAAFGK